MFTAYWVLTELKEKLSFSLKNSRTPLHYLWIQLKYQNWGAANTENQGFILKNITVTEVLYYRVHNCFNGGFYITDQINKVSIGEEFSSMWGILTCTFWDPTLKHSFWAGNNTILVTGNGGMEGEKKNWPFLLL